MLIAIRLPKEKQVAYYKYILFSLFKKITKKEISFNHIICLNHHK